MIIRDSESSYESAAKSVKSALLNAGFPAPSGPNTIAHDETIKTAFSLFPSLSKSRQNGTLEDLYIKNLCEDNHDQIVDSINSFLGDLKEKGRSFRWLHKSKIHTYFSVTDDFVSMKIGQATEAGAFDFACAEMNALKELLTDIAT